MFKIKHVRVLPYTSIEPSVKFPGFFDILFGFSHFYRDFSQIVAHPDQKVIHYFEGSIGCSEALGVTSGHNFLQTTETLYFRASSTDVGKGRKSGGLKWMKDNCQVWVLKPMQVSDEIRKELDTLISKEVWE